MVSRAGISTMPPNITNDIGVTSPRPAPKGSLAMSNFVPAAPPCQQPLQPTQQQRQHVNLLQRCSIHCRHHIFLLLARNRWQRLSIWPQFSTWSPIQRQPQLSHRSHPLHQHFHPHRQLAYQPHLRPLPVNSVSKADNFELKSSHQQQRVSRA